MRIGLDFGTTTTLIAVRVDQQEPRVVPLERDTDWMPSYFWRGDDGSEAIGARAANLPSPVRSIKLELPRDEASDETYGIRPSTIALRIVEEALGRAVTQLKRDRLLPADADLLEISTNIGCTSAWNLETRVRLRDIAAAAGLKVTMANVIEEPVAAALAVALTGALARGGRLLMIDIGGGTLDVCVLRAEAGTNRFTIFASDGDARVGGDRYTDLIDDYLRRRLAESLDRPDESVALSHADATRLWQVAESAKQDLSRLTSVRVQVPAVDGIPGPLVTVTRDWFEHESRRLVRMTRDAVTNAYRIARLTLDRGDHPEDEPGTPYLRTNPIRLISNLSLHEDGLEHIDHVVLVGGASEMPMIRQAFEDVFGSRLEDPKRYGLEPISAVVIGLAQHDALESLDFGYPNWAIDVEVRTPEGTRSIELYTPFAPIFKPRIQWSTFLYDNRWALDDEATSLRVMFRRVAPGVGHAWGWVAVPPSTSVLRLRLSLLGDIQLTAEADGVEIDLYEDTPATPWKVDGVTHPDWIPRKTPDFSDVPVWDPRNDGPG